jgi:hypothetical protein
MREIVTDFQPFENPRKPLKIIAWRYIMPLILPTKNPEDPKNYRRGNGAPFVRAVEYAIWSRKGCIDRRG